LLPRICKEDCRDPQVKLVNHRRQLISLVLQLLHHSNLRLSNRSHLLLPSTSNTALPHPLPQLQYRVPTPNLHHQPLLHLHQRTNNSPPLTSP
jgi:hypothetical protein